MQRLIQFNKKAWLKSYIDINTKLITEPKNDLEKCFFKLMSIAVFGKALKNIRKHTDIKLVTKNKKGKFLVSEPNYHTPKCFSLKLLAIKTKK